MQMVTLNKDDIYQGPLVLVNHNYPIANNYQITNCSTAKDSTISLEKTAMEMLTKALQEIKAEDKIVLVSGLRSGQEQAMIYNQAIQNHGKEFVDKFVARVNCSEHQTGLAIDLAVKNETIDIFCPDFTSQEICQQFRDILPKLVRNHGIFAMLGLFMQKLWKKISGVLKNIIYI